MYSFNYINGTVVHKICIINSQEKKNCFFVKSDLPDNEWLARPINRWDKRIIWNYIFWLSVLIHNFCQLFLIVVSYRGWELAEDNPGVRNTIIETGVTEVSCQNFWIHFNKIRCNLFKTINYPS